MKHAVMAVAVAFGPQIALVRRPARTLAKWVMAYLDHRKKVLNDQ